MQMRLETLRVDSGGMRFRLHPMGERRSILTIVSQGGAAADSPRVMLSLSISSELIRR